jgi:hypothetical protein
MFVARANDFIAHPALIAQIALLAAAGLNAAIVHSRGALDAANPWTRLQVGLSILIWISVIFCARFIAYA